MYLGSSRDVSTRATDVTAVAPKISDKIHRFCALLRIYELYLNPANSAHDRVGTVAPEFSTSCVVSSKLEEPQACRKRGGLGGFIPPVFVQTVT